MHDNFKIKNNLLEIAINNNFHGIKDAILLGKDFKDYKNKFYTIYDELLESLQIKAENRIKKIIEDNSVENSYNDILVASFESLGELDRLSTFCSNYLGFLDTKISHLKNDFYFNSKFNNILYYFADNYLKDILMRVIYNSKKIIFESLKSELSSNSLDRDFYSVDFVKIYFSGESISYESICKLLKIVKQNVPKNFEWILYISRKFFTKGKYLDLCLEIDKKILEAENTKILLMGQRHLFVILYIECCINIYGEYMRGDYVSFLRDTIACNTFYIESFENFESNKFLFELYIITGNEDLLQQSFKVFLKYKVDCIRKVECFFTQFQEIYYLCILISEINKFFNFEISYKEVFSVIMDLQKIQDNLIRTAEKMVLENFENLKIFFNTSLKKFGNYYKKRCQYIYRKLVLINNKEHSNLHEKHINELANFLKVNFPVLKCKEHSIIKEIESTTDNQYILKTAKDIFKKKGISLEILEDVQENEEFEILRELILKFFKDPLRNIMCCIPLDIDVDDSDLWKFVYIDFCKFIDFFITLGYDKQQYVENLKNQLVMRLLTKNFVYDRECLFIGCLTTNLKSSLSQVIFEHSLTKNNLKYFSILNEDDIKEANEIYTKQQLRAQLKEKYSQMFDAVSETDFIKELDWYSSGNELELFKSRFDFIRKRKTIKNDNSLLLVKKNRWTKVAEFQFDDDEIVGLSFLKKRLRSNLSHDSVILVFNDLFSNVNLKINEFMCKLSILYSTNALE